ncbi:hypothetical protein [Streptomyces sp. A0958]|nr:hypothetical protein [Streptomyces sp. A0958]
MSAIAARADKAYAYAAHKNGAYWRRRGPRYTFPAKADHPRNCQMLSP